MKTNDNLIPIETLIKKLKTKNISLGKGDPYNRLRYYTKLGWIPHMTRQKDKKGNVIGHYPKNTIEIISEIAKLKKQGLSNEEVSKKINLKSKYISLAQILNLKTIKTQIYPIIIIVLLMVVILLESRSFDYNNLKSEQLLNSTPESSLPKTIIESGSFYVPKNTSSIFIKTKKPISNHIVHITFNESYAPATRYWAEKSVKKNGFYVRLDAPLNKDVRFSWWLSQ